MSKTPFLNRYSNERQHYARLVDKMYNSYHNSSINLLQDEVAYHQNAQYMKRFYLEKQFAYKIDVLSDFYQYHRELPRIFHQNIDQIIQNFQEDWRALEYKFVSKKIKEDQAEQIPQTLREKTHRPVQKLLKNIQLSYYNFQNKCAKKQKASENVSKNKQSSLNRNKKSMPLLPLYRFPKPKISHQKTNIESIIKVLDLKQPNQNHPQKFKQRQLSKKASANNSIECQKNLSRTKSKSNLVTAFGLHQTKKTTAKQPNNVNRTDKTKSTQVSLQKAQSTKNILQWKKPEVRSKVMKLQQRKQQEIKNMFKRLSQAKKSIKVGR